MSSCRSLRQPVMRLVARLSASAELARITGLAGCWAKIVVVGCLSRSTFVLKCVIFHTDNCYLGGLVQQFWFLGCHFGSLKAPWGTMGTAGSTRGDAESDLLQLGNDVGT